MEITFKDAVNRQIIQRDGYKILGKAAVAAIMKEFAETVAKVTDGSIMIEPLQPTGWKIHLKLSIEVAVRDVTKGIPAMTSDTMNPT